jgi:hypothetical protein
VFERNSIPKTIIREHRRDRMKILTELVFVRDRERKTTSKYIGGNIDSVERGRIFVSPA